MTTSSRPGPASDPSTRVASQRKDELDVNSRRCRTGYCTTCVARALAHEPRGCPSGHFRARAWPRHPRDRGRLRPHSYNDEKADALQRLAALVENPPEATWWRNYCAIISLPKT